MSCDDEFLVFRKYVAMLVGVAAVDRAFYPRGSLNLSYLNAQGYRKLQDFSQHTFHAQA
jgi:hypothetical protein